MMITSTADMSMDNPHSANSFPANLSILDIAMINLTPTLIDDGTVIDCEDIEYYTRAFYDIDGAEHHPGDMSLLYNNFQTDNASDEPISNLHGDRSPPNTGEHIEYTLSLSATHEANSMLQKKPSYSADHIASTDDIQRPKSPNTTELGKNINIPDIAHGPKQHHSHSTTAERPVHVSRSTKKCDYAGCHKAFLRNEHLKRHKQSSHGEGPNKFSCEFCGKDSFNRQDNLDCHRKLHARPKSGKRGVEFIAAAVPVIQKEQRSRKRQK